ncbi:hypothetical protein C8R43DRAFT_1116537 [Mycena crocata]|nr:hypothetical protein C8R43DRAFT_1116537 [Mycena crocata]
MTERMDNMEDTLSIDDVPVVGIVLEDDDYEADWVAGTKGGSDFWARADAFVGKRRRGEIEPKSRWIEDSVGI